MYLKYVNDFRFITRYMCFCSKEVMNKFSDDGAQIVLIAQPLVSRKYFKLNIKLFKVRMRAKTVVIRFVATVVFVRFS